MAFPLISRASVAGDCTKDTCPAEMSIYGYAPNWEFNLFFTIFFAISGLVFHYQALLIRTWKVYGAMCAVGCAMEVGGYVGRLMLSKDPFSDMGFKLNVIFLTIAPAFFSAAIYLTLKQAIVVFGQHLARMGPSWYLYTFVVCDSISLLLQGAGGAISSIAEEKKLLDDGVDILIAGLVFQVISLLVFLGLTLDYANCCRQKYYELSAQSKRMLHSNKFQMFITGTSLAFLCILTRCCYRIAELCHGWGSEIMRKEVDFIIMDSDMIVLAAIIMNILYPGIFWKVSDTPQYEDIESRKLGIRMVPGSFRSG